MADTAIAITAGAGTNVDTRTEATNGNHRQVVVLGDPSTNAGVAPVDATAGLKVDLGADNDVTVAVLTALSKAEDAAHASGDTGIPALAVRRDAKASGAADGDYVTINTNADGDVRVDGGQAFIVRVEPTVTAGAYTANDTLGGEQTITAAARVSGGGGVLTGITMIAQDDSANLWVASDVKVLIFQSNPAGTYTDNAALDSSSLTDADAQDLLLGAFTLDTAVTLGNIVMLKATNVNMPYVCSGSANLFAVAINVGGRTPDATDGITFLYHMIRD